MGLPLPTSKKLVTNRTKENLSVKELRSWMNSEGMSDQELADIFGVSIQAVKLWLNGERDVSTTNTRLIRMFQKHPKLLREF